MILEDPVYAPSFQVPNGAGIDAAGNVTAIGDLIAATAGKGLKVKENAVAGRMGVTAAMAAGTTGAIANTTVTANTRVLCFHTGGGVVANYGHLYCSARVAGVSFTISSSNGADTDAVLFLLVEPA